MKIITKDDRIFNKHIVKDKSGGKTTKKTCYRDYDSVTQTYSGKIYEMVYNWTGDVLSTIDYTSYDSDGITVKSTNTVTLQDDGGTKEHIRDIEPQMLIDLDYEDIVYTGNFSKIFMPTARVSDGVSGALGIINTTSDVTFKLHRILFNKTMFQSGTYTAKLRGRFSLKNSAETVYTNLYQSDIQESAFTLVTGSEVSHTGDTNWVFFESSDFWDNLNAGDLLLEIRGRSSTASQNNCGMIYTDDLFYVVIERTA